MGIAYEGDLGQYPNLDLINVATDALRNQNLAPQVLSLLRSLLACTCVLVHKYKDRHLRALLAAQLRSCSLAPCY